MLPALVRRQLLALALITVLGGGYVLYQYVDLPRLLGAGRIPVSVELPTTGGLYAGSIVTYRGRQIGQVEDVVLSPTAVTARLWLQDDARVPRDLDAAVHSTSALGEQYLDLRPRTAGGPLLAAGDVVPLARTRMPTPTADTLEAVTALVDTLPATKLRAVLDETHAALSGSSTDVALLLDSARRLVDAARTDIRPTTQLITDLPPVLARQQQLRDPFLDSSANLARVTERLRASDPDLRGTIEGAGPLLDENDALLRQLRPSLPPLFAAITGLSSVTTTYRENIRQTLIVFPIALNQFQSAVNGSGDPGLVKANARLVLNDPPPCTLGYPDPAQRRDPQDLSPRTAAAGVLCREPTGSPIGVRMAHNYPCPPGSPAGPLARSADARGCGLSFQSPAEEQARRRADLAVQDDVAARNPRHRGEEQRPPGPGSPSLPDPPLRPARAR